MLFIPSFVDYKLKVKDLIKVISFQHRYSRAFDAVFVSTSLRLFIPGSVHHLHRPTPPWPAMFTSERLTREAKSSGLDGDGERNSNLLQTASLINTQCTGLYRYVYKLKRKRINTCIYIYIHIKLHTYISTSNNLNALSCQTLQQKMLVYISKFENQTNSGRLTKTCQGHPTWLIQL